VRTSSVLRGSAWGILVAGAVLPVVRRRVRVPQPAVLGAAAGAPAAVCVLWPRSLRRDVVVCGLQMWAYVTAYQMPHDDPEALERRVHVDYPVRIDRVLGLGRLPSLRLQQGLARAGIIRTADKILVWAHWLWFLVPHSALAYLRFRRPERFPRAAVLTYAVFDVGLIGYWALPTAPPWYAALHGRIDGEGPALRRMMAEHGQAFWKDAWGPIYHFLGGNPLAAMPSLHFATSVMAAQLLAESGPGAGVIGWTYALTLGFALVYLGEHYVVDLLAGLSLTQAVRRAELRAAPLALAVARGIRRLEAVAAA
jgi:membrane-associated phospholipid phosphatase